jgi:hypothetical protein
MAGFTFKLEQEDGTPADPPVIHSAVPTCRPATPFPNVVRSVARVPRPVLEGLLQKEVGAGLQGRVSVDHHWVLVLGNPSSQERAFSAETRLPFCL